LAQLSWFPLFGSPVSAAELDGALVGAVFVGDAAIYAPPPVDLSASARACRNAYLGALPRPIARDAGQTLRHPKQLLAARRDFLARQSEAVAGAKGLDDARRFAQSLTLHVEWEGMSEPPLLEARQAQQWAEMNPASPIVPVAQLFAAHRYRAAYECDLLAGDGAGAASAAAAWHDAIAAARRGHLPLVECLADDLVRVDHVYLAGAGHPDATVEGPQGTTQTIALADLRAALAAPRYAESFAGEVATGETYSHWFGPALEFALLPVGGGWEIAVRHSASPENLARLTPPLHFLPNPRDVEPWHVLPVPSGCAGPDPQQAPAARREFIYSRAVGTTIDGPGASRPVSPEEIAQIRRDGHGVMEILSVIPGPVREGCPTIGRLRFRLNVFGRR
jgi:hypothetical protein